MIYFLQGRFGGPIKIGTTVYLPDRHKQLEALHGRTLVVLATMPGSYPEETSLHRQFAAHRIKGTEFFRENEDLRSLIASLPPYTETRKQTDHGRPFVTAAHARRLLGKDAFKAMLADGRIGVRQFPGVQPTYLREDVERLARDRVA